MQRRAGGRAAPPRERRRRSVHRSPVLPSAGFGPTAISAWPTAAARAPSSSQTCAVPAAWGWGPPPTTCPTPAPSAAAALRTPARPPMHQSTFPSPFPLLNPPADPRLWLVPLLHAYSAGPDSCRLRRPARHPGVPPPARLGRRVEPPAAPGRGPGAGPHLHDPWCVSGAADGSGAVFLQVFLRWQGSYCQAAVGRWRLGAAAAGLVRVASQQGLCCRAAACSGREAPWAPPTLTTTLPPMHAPPLNRRLRAYSEME